MTITDQQKERVKGIILDGAKLHFPPSVRFEDANVTVRLDADDEEFLDVELLYTAPNPVLDGHLMNTFFRVFDEPIRVAGVTAHILIGYTDVNDPTRPEYRESPTSPAPSR